LSEHPSAATSAIKLDQLIALNDEMAALARAGVPLEKGLISLGSDLPGSLGRIAGRLGQRLESGQDLTQALADDASLPPAYRALVAAGIRSGRLAAAMEGMSTLIRRAAETRSVVAISLIYPLFLLAVAYGLFVFTLVNCFPVLVAAYKDFVPGSKSLWLIDRLAQTAPQWAPWLPPAVAVLLVLWWLRSRRAWHVEGRRGSERRWSSERFPTIGHLLYAGRVATFADVLALLVEHDVPLDEAIALAADASGDRRLRESGRQLAEQVQRGERLSGAPSSQGMPPVLGWLLVTFVNQTQLVIALRRAADSYRRRTRWMLHRLSVSLPFWLTTGIGGTAVVLYALSVFVPWCRILCELGKP
jgi:general secretion pathway protein F